MSLLIGGIVWITTQENVKLFQQVLLESEESAYLDKTLAVAREIDALVHRHIISMKGYGYDIVRSLMDDNELSPVYLARFRKEDELVFLEVKEQRRGNIRSLKSLANQSFLDTHQLDTPYFKAVEQRGELNYNSAFRGQIQIVNVSGNIPLLKIEAPLIRQSRKHYTHIVSAFLRLNRFQRPFSNDGKRLLYLVDAFGKIVAHPDEKMIIKAKDYSNSPIVNRALHSDITNELYRYKDPIDQRTYLAAYARTSFGLIVVAQAPEDLIALPAEMVKRQAYYILGMVLSFSFLLLFIFSSTITTSIEELALITKEISKGNFNIRASRRIRSGDEVGALAKSFDVMVMGLKERDKMQLVLNKFHGAKITETLLKKELALGGHARNVIVLFCDIRSFGQYSSTNDAEEVVSMLNAYFESMVGIILEYGGVVDKFIGDAIMAVWGAPDFSEKDGENALKACLDMRKALDDFNCDRITKGLTPIRIGMGLFRGPVVSGIIGTQQRMEYTVIGETVNIASRIEESTKLFGTDLLIDESEAADLQDKFILEFAGNVQIKGQAEPLRLFKVNGYFDEEGAAHVVQTPYSSFEPETTPKVQLA